MQKFEFIIDENKANIRLDKFLTDQFLSILPEINRSKIAKLFDEKAIFDETKKILKASSKTKLKQVIEVIISEPKASSLLPTEIDFEIIFEDEDLLIINKPANLTVHPGAGNQQNTLVNALLFSHKNKLSSINGELRPGIVHRLDKDTSGLMVVAKNDFTHQKLSEMLKNREIKRSYLAIIYGVMNPQKGRIEKNIARSRANRLKMITAKNSGKTAITNYQTKEIFFSNLASLVECNLETGRTHQIRSHLESEKHSIIGDQLYNSCKKTLPKDLPKEVAELIKNFPRQALHSYKISFLHPRSSQEISFEIDLADDIKKLYQCLKKLS
jgi:23S rRNA pseudouridine1911/1915/1917 synthase